MEPPHPHQEKKKISEQPRTLTKSEIESLQQEMKEASIWLEQEIQRRKKTLNSKR